MSPQIPITHLIIYRVTTNRLRARTAAHPAVDGVRQLQSRWRVQAGALLRYLL
jgi:hypothetical protein